MANHVLRACGRAGAGGELRVAGRPKCRPAGRGPGAPVFKQKSLPFQEDFLEKHAWIWEKFERFAGEIGRVYAEEIRCGDELYKHMKEAERLMVAIYDELEKEMRFAGGSHRYDKEVDELRASIEMCRITLRTFKENEDQIDAAWKRRRGQVSSKNAE